MALDDNILEALSASYRFIIPEMVLVAAACVLFLASTFRVGRHVAGSIALLAVIVAGAIHFLAPFHFAPELVRAATFNGPLVPDALASLVRVIALGGGIVLILFSWHEVPQRYVADFFACLLLIVAGIALDRRRQRPDRAVFVSGTRQHTNLHFAVLAQT